MKDITDLFFAYRECARNLWNVYFYPQLCKYENESRGKWDISDEYDDICTRLFNMLVLCPIEKTNYQKTASYESIKETLPFISIVPKGEVPILINREKNNSMGYWDYPMKSINPSDAEMLFVDYFDFDKLGYRDFEYYQVRIIASNECPDLIDRDALIAPQYVNLFLKSDSA
jgi:hypothetical protein